MKALLKYNPLLRRKSRIESWEAQGVSSLEQTRQAIRDSSPTEALEMFECYVAEMRWLYDGYLAWVRDWVTSIGQREGAQLWDYLARAHLHLEQMAMPTLPAEIAEQVVAATESGVTFDQQAGYRRPETDTVLPASRWMDIGVDAEIEFRLELNLGQQARALALLERVHREHKPVHDAYSDLLWLWMTMIAERWGEEAMFELMIASGRRLRTPGIEALPGIPIEEQVRMMAGAMRGHRSGPGEEGDIRVLEDDEKYVIEFDACGSGGRMRRTGEIDHLPPRHEAPFNLGSTRKSSPMSWNRPGVPYYCTHCAAYSEILSTDLIGYPSRVTLFNPDGAKACAWAFYKDPGSIPEEYFTRIGRKRDPSKFVIASPAAPPERKTNV